MYMIEYLSISFMIYNHDLSVNRVHDDNKDTPNGQFLKHLFGSIASCDTDYTVYAICCYHRNPHEEFHIVLD